MIDLSDRTVSPDFIDTHVHLTMDASRLALQTLESSASKALKGLSIACQYMSYGFTTLRDLGSADPDSATVDLRNAINQHGGRAPAHRCRGYSERKRGSWRPARILWLSMDSSGLIDCR